MVRVRGVAVRWACLAGLLLTGGCADLYLTQSRDDLLVRTGNVRTELPAAPHADLVLDYALLADQSYADSLYDPAIQKPVDVGPNTYCIDRMRPGDPCFDRLGLTTYAIARLSKWRRIFAAKELGAFPCTRGEGACGDPLTGLGVQVWMKGGARCTEAAIVFRGTDGQSADDWLSNLRWLLRLAPLYDQYDQVADYTPDFVRRLEAEPCFRKGRTRIVAIGHSLGGGLAQHAAFRDGRIRHVTAIDPSFVTGIESLDPALVARNVRGLGIEQVYEHGEVLSYPRFVLRQLSPLPTCDPLVRTIRLNTVRGNPITQHNLSSMATSLLAWSKDRRGLGQRADVPWPGPTATTCRTAPRPT